MKAFVCELCGSSELVKQDGFFVCQTCGTKYTLEDAKQLLRDVDGPVEIKGTVTVDNSAQIQNFLEMARTAFSGNDVDGVIKYSDKILEIDPNNFEAWALRAKSACWNSSLNNNKIPQSIAAAQKAVELAPEDQKSAVADDIYLQLKRTVVGLLTNAYRMPLAYGPQHVHNVMVSWNNVLVGIPHLSKELIQKEIADCKTTCDNSRSAILPSKRYVFAAYTAYNKKESYDAMFRRNLGLS